MTDIPHGKYPGTDTDGLAKTEADHHMKCPVCGRWFDTRDVGQVAEHSYGGPEEPMTISILSNA
jgi:hypothetical protein